MMHLLAVLGEVHERGRSVSLHARLREVVHDRHQAGQQARVLRLLQLRPQVRAQLPNRLARRPPHLGVPVLQTLRGQ